MRILESSLIPHKYSLKSSVVRLSVPDMGNGGSCEGTLWATCEDTLFIRSSSGRRMLVSSGVHWQFCLNRKKCHHLYTCSIHLQFLVSSLQNKIKIKYIEFSLFSNEVQTAFKLPRFSGENLHCKLWNPCTAGEKASKNATASSNCSSASASKPCHPEDPWTTNMPYSKLEFEKTLPLFKVWNLLELCFEGWRTKLSCRRADSHVPKEIHATYPSQTNQSLKLTWLVIKKHLRGLCDEIPPTVPMSMLSALSSHAPE